MSHPTALLERGAHLRADGISKSYPDRRVLTDVSLTVPAGERRALIGENGTGKSTLLRILAGVEPADSGELHAPGRVGLLWQQLPFELTATLAEVAEDAQAAPRAALQEFDDATAALAGAPHDGAAAHRYAAALEVATHADVWNLDRHVDMVLDGVGLGGLDPARPTGELSGGQRARLALAWLLLARPDTLLLDEPTNHLDDHGVAFLAEMLATWAGPVLFASHDRAFLDEVATGIIDLDPAPRPHTLLDGLGEGPASGVGTTAWTGTFTDYLAARRDEYDRWQRQYRDEQDELKRLQQQLRASHQVGHAGATPRTEGRAAKKFYADRNATVVSRRVNDFTARLDELKTQQVAKPPALFDFAGLDIAPRTPHGVPSVVLAASGVAVDGRLQPTSITIGRSEKWLVTGANGSGKSTLLKLLAGQLAPDAGTVTSPRQVTLAMLDQDVDLDPDLSPAQAYADRLGIARAEQVPLGQFGLVHPRDLHRRLGSLSVGQQRRLALAIVLAGAPDVLVLDEPTNHFSLALATALEQALPSYPGAVVIASHDRWLRRAWTGLRLSLDGSGTIEA
ncbi:ABC-F family ATP-binding cassette domain-containing protein [Propionibacteriaceae bacterium G1746]|uniref:ABC-F family ATP-binding cassette domain-containing protein n=1 Tax=Aestuariimicrobium sp. G57 TaxID=3418485 RepID=UPI003C222234